MGASAAGRSTPPPSPTLAAGKISSSRSWPSPALPGNPRPPPLRPARRRPRRADGAGQPHRLAAGSGDHSPGGRRPMLRAAPGLEVRDSATGHMTSPVILTEGVARLRHDIEQHLPDGAAQAEHDASTFFATDLPALSAWRFSGQDARRITQPVLYLGGTASGPWRFTSSSLAGCRRRRL
jgi:hypothetical protein